MTKRRKFSPEFKAQAVLEIISGAKTQAEIARQHRIKPELIVRWRRQFVENAASLFARGGSRDDSDAEERIAELERALGKKGLSKSEPTFTLSTVLIGDTGCLTGQSPSGRPGRERPPSRVQTVVSPLPEIGEVEAPAQP